MTTFIDTSTIYAALRDTEPHHQWATDAIDAARADGPIYVPDLVFVELCYDRENVGEVEAIIEEMAFERIEHTHEALFLASKTYRRYREDNRGPKLNVPADFMIGAVAQSERAPLLTANEDDFLRYFDTLEVICPTGRRTADPRPPRPRRGRR